ncbi:hypothetical protein GVN16_01575 [Emticicia sp. CRIBPO]|uniref:COR domain-containing protein n=1 Tax=Emticicia sp. CRIBPO TaxID=2683258 RepID=UPI00141220C0|nr:COR domain-containing protein [Emticicia sp. CRIBPO]NBA84429.1 hypothetical protein [Emticicia sp. CRIBPO]
MSDLARQLIAENKKTKATFLDLGMCGLVNEIPEELGDCVWLEELNFGKYYINENGRDTESENGYVQNEFVGYRLRILSKLKNLKFLHLYALGISDLSFIGGLSQLICLNLSHNRISDLRFIFSLKGLQRLDLSYNRISDLSFISGFSDLQYLDLSHNKISDLSFIRGLSGLQYLDLSYNSINDSGDGHYLKGLKYSNLDLSKVSDLSAIGGLNGLKYLDLSVNNVSDLNFISGLYDLMCLNISRNDVKDISPLLYHIKKGLSVRLEEGLFTDNGIIVSDNPIMIPPKEVLLLGNETIIEHFEGKLTPLNECKLIFVGDGSVGKTSLMKCLVGIEFDKYEKTTHGINKIAWTDLKTKKKEAIKVNLWDFGGQHIQHSLHQFFFSERVIYVLVLDPRNDQKANYWLEQIEKLGCDSEIFIVYNWKNKEDKVANFLGNFYELRKRYTNLREPYLLSCKTGEGVIKFKRELSNCIKKSEGLTTKYRKEWFKIKNQLEIDVSVEANYIDYDDYKTLCIGTNYYDPESQQRLLKILNSIGSIVYFDKPILDQYPVLNPEWITTGAYAVLTAKQTNDKNGHLTWNDLKQIFKEEKEIFSDKSIKIKYNENQFLFIMQLMINYNLCQIKPFAEHEYLIPSAFGERPLKEYETAKADARQYRFQFESPFEMLIIHRFIAMNIEKSQGEDYWQSGIYIKHSSETYALVETNQYSNRIDCWIKGENIRGFWEVIRADFREIFRVYKKFSFEEEVLYLKDGKEYFLSYKEMETCFKDGVTFLTYHPIHRISVNVLEVLELFQDKSETEKIMKEEKKTDVHQVFNFNPHFEQNNTNSNVTNVKVDITGSDQLEAIKEILLDLQDTSAENKEWRDILIKSLDEFSRLEMAEDKAAQKTSVSIIERSFKKLKDFKDVVTIGLLPVDMTKKIPELFKLWDDFKLHFL